MNIIKRNIGVIESLSSLFILKFVDLILPLLVIPFLINKVGSANYGIYAFANSIFIYLLNISQYGFALSSVRDISVHREDQVKINEIFNRVFSTKCFLVLLNIIFLFIAVLLIPFLRDHWQLYFFMSVMLIGDLFMPSWYFYGIEKMRFITFINLTLKSTFAILIFFFVRDKADYLYIPFYQSIGYIFSGIAGFYFVVYKFHIKVSLNSVKIIFKELKEGFSSFLNLISPSVYTNTAVFVVGVYLSSKQVSIIQVTMVIVSSFGGINTIMTNALYPFLNKNKSGFNKAKNIFIISGILFSLFIFFVAPIILQYWVGSKFEKSEMDQIFLIVKIFSISPFLMSMVSAFGVNGLLVHRQDKRFSYITIFSTLICFALAFALTPIFSIIGAAVAIVVGRAIYAFASYFYYKRLVI